MSDLVVNVRQISNYPASGVLPSDSILMQRGGLGGPYVSIDAATLVGTALQQQGGPIGIGVVPPTPADGTQAFAGWFAALNGFFINTYFNGTDIAAWQSGPVGVFDFEGPGSGDFQWQVAQGSAGQPLPPLTQVMQLTHVGNLSLPLGTLTVARDPTYAMDVATLNWVSNNTAASFNGRIGRVTLTANDVYQALSLTSAIATQQWTISAIDAAIGNLLTTYPLVTCWNGRTGNVWLMLSDITTVFFQPGQQPISPTPPVTSNDNSIATTQWVTDYVTNLGIDGHGLATEAWVLANTVNSFNGRMGPVQLTQADVMNVGAAPLNSPNFSGIPTAPTAAVGQATGQIATTAFVQQAISANVAGVSSFNTRSGDVTLTTADITAAGGLTNPSPNLTGSPSAPTAAPGTSTPQIANTQFVMTAVNGAVTSFNTRTGAVVLTTADITGAGGAPLVSPNFSSVPTAPTAAPGTNTVQLATCAFVTAALNTAGGVSSFNGRTGAVDLIGNDISAAGGLVNPSVNLTGIPTAPTATAGTNTSQIATTQFVVAALGGTVTSFNTRSGAVTLTGADISAAGGALLAGPAFTGAPTAPTATAGTNTTQLATTQFVQSAILADTSGVTSFNSRTGAVLLTTADITGAGGAPSASPAFTGIPVAPTATAGTSTTQLATTQFVQSAIASSGVASFNGRTGAVTLIANDISAASGALLDSPTFTGTPAAPTAAPGTNTTQLATCAYVQAAVSGGPFVPLAGGTMTGVLNLTAGTIAAPGLVLGAVATQKGLYATGTALGIAVNGASLANFTATVATIRTSVFDARGNFGIGVTPPATAATSNAVGGWGFSWGVVSQNFGNIYYDGTNNRYQATGNGWQMVCDPASNMGFFFYGNGAAGAVTPAATMMFAMQPGFQTGGRSLMLASNGYMNYFGTSGTAIKIYSCNGVNFDTSCPNGTSNSFVMGYNLGANGALTISVDGGGAVFTLISNVSDARMKDGIADSTLDCLATVQMLALKEYRWKDIRDPWELDGVQPRRGAPLNRVGLIAQEVAEVFPDGVLEGDDQTDSLGRVWALDSNNFLALLVGAVQQMDRSNNVLRERIEALEARMTEMGV